ncbi:hypothetical protein AB9K41_13040, partial [Cribrihabitans sp. XS_ASV171]
MKPMRLSSVTGGKAVFFPDHNSNVDRQKETHTVYVTEWSQTLECKSQMTIGIAAYGPEAGRAVLEGALATEILGCGSIRGFTVFSVLDEQGAHRQFACQNGGVSAIDGIEAFYDARCAALISSGPNRPEPLSQFLVGVDSVGLITGHRLPQRQGASGLPLNTSTIQRIGRGEAPIAAVHAELSENPEADCGLIALSADGRIGFGNSARVERRNDLMEASRLEEKRGYALLGNSVYFRQGCQPCTVIGDIIWARLAGRSCGFFLAQLSGPVPVLSAS